jgi:hypothetical protein
MGEIRIPLNENHETTLAWYPLGPLDGKPTKGSFSGEIEMKVTFLNVPSRTQDCSNQRDRSCKNYQFLPEQGVSCEACDVTFCSLECHQRWCKPMEYLKKIGQVICQRKEASRSHCILMVL